MPEPRVSADAIADHLGVTKDSVYTSIAKTGMPAHRVGRLWKFKITEADMWARCAAVDETASKGADG